MIQTLLKTLLLTLLFAGALSGVHHLTSDRIDEQKQNHVAKQLASILPSGYFEPPLHPITEPLMIPGTNQTATVHLAYQNQQPRAVLLDWITPNGYSGDIRLLLAIKPDGEVIGVRVLEHRETPGLGDAIEHDKSNWMRQFMGTSIDTPAPNGWQADRLGGEFDTISSATITSSAVIEAIASALHAYDRESKTLWEKGAGQRQTIDD